MHSRSVFATAIIAMLTIASPVSADTRTRASIDIAPERFACFRQADESTRALIARVIGGFGGEAVLPRVSSIRKVSSIDQLLPKPIHVDFDGTARFPDVLVANIHLPSRNLMAIRTADNAYVYRSNSPIAGAALKLNEAEQKTFSAFFFSSPVSILQNLRSTKVRFAEAGQDIVNGNAVDVLAVSLEGYEVRWFIDKETGRVLRTKFEDRITDFEDWRSVDGVILPFRETVSRNGEIESRAVVKSFTLNPAIDSAALAMPKFWEQRYNLPARDEFTRHYTVYYYFYWLYY